jgi:nucleotide-binding universal stress UspA family protein
LLRRLIVPLDGSSFAEHALPAAVAVARATDGEIRLVSVLERPLGSVSTDESTFGRARRSEYLSEVVTRILRIWSGPVSAVVREGWVVAELEAEAVDWQADLIAMSTHGGGGVSRLWIGSQTDRCVRAGFCPILLVRPPDKAAARDVLDSDPLLPVARVVAPLDGSALAECALPYASAIAEAFGAPVLLMRVVTQPVGVELPQVPEAIELAEGFRDQDRAEAHRYLDGRLRSLRQVGIDAAALVSNDSDPARAIADRAPGDLIVMCTRGRGALEPAVFGSVTDKVVRAGNQPVLVIPMTAIRRFAATSAASEAS